MTAAWRHDAPPRENLREQAARWALRQRDDAALNDAAQAEMQAWRAADHANAQALDEALHALQLLDRAAGSLGKVLPVLLQINAGHDPAKFGAEPADAPALLEAALAAVEGYAAEHVALLGPKAESLAPRIRNAGAVFVGRFAADDVEVVGRGLAVVEHNLAKVLQVVDAALEE